MSWNRPSDGEGSVSVKPPQHDRRSRLAVWCVAGTLVVMGAGMAAWLLWPDTSEPVVKDGDGTEKSLIKEVKPAVVRRPVPGRQEISATTNAASARERSIKGAHGLPELVRDGEGNLWFCGSKVPKDKLGTARRNGKPWGHRSYFKRAADNYLLSTFVTGKTGGPMVTRGELSDRFVEAVAKSLDTPAIIDGDEDDDAKAQAADLAELKQILKDKISQGDDLKQILKDTIRDQQKISAARQNYSQMYRELLQKDPPLREVEDFVNAANSILDKYNAIPLKIAPGVRARLKQLDAERKTVK